MRSDKKVIKLLNKCLSDILIANNQYFVHARMYKNWGLNELDEQEYRKSVQCMKTADCLLERLLFLRGAPHLQTSGKIRIGGNTQEVLDCDLNLQMSIIKDLQEGIAYCESVSDCVSKDLLAGILVAEEEHVAWIEAQFGLIDNLSIQSPVRSKERS